MDFLQNVSSPYFYSASCFIFLHRDIGACVLDKPEKSPLWLEVLGVRFATLVLMIITNSAHRHFFHIELVHIANDNGPFTFLIGIHGSNFNDYLLISLFHWISRNFLLPLHIYLLCWFLTLLLDLISGSSY